MSIALLIEPTTDDPADAVELAGLIVEALSRRGKGVVLVSDASTALAVGLARYGGAWSDEADAVVAYASLILLPIIPDRDTFGQVLRGGDGDDPVAGLLQLGSLTEAVVVPAIGPAKPADLNRLLGANDAHPGMILSGDAGPWAMQFKDGQWSNWQPSDAAAELEPGMPGGMRDAVPEDFRPAVEAAYRRGAIAAACLAAIDDLLRGAEP
ncbi:hypothetical protein HZF05_07590 [Sphingomonas sp. CGMCC 1.13654]|uniref:Uncharacterized protein n=1 Tax=Sphingomonas chungangi TaxID=2683589 RepID=A0A838L3J5_9SPHN|nr:hypothetical protein [Sphingomonas chungangi]MBA2933961.1 hypothetical protein [Sphingomonas chungangi]MVW57087.1 hypothetical protein [Sphingomonas chungangi]